MGWNCCRHRQSWLRVKLTPAYVPKRPVCSGRQGERGTFLAEYDTLAHLLVKASCFFRFVTELLVSARVSVELLLPLCGVPAHSLYLKASINPFLPSNFPPPLPSF
jgi:hypothetical protein